MSVKGVDIKVGDKLRYLGGDIAGATNYCLKEGREYKVTRVNNRDGYIIAVGAGTWYVGEDVGNEDCFEKVEEESGKTALDLIANLAQEVAQLKHELSELRDAIQSQAYEDNERIERILDDIVMLDERTQGVNNDGQKLLSKEVYIYDTE